MAAKGNFKKRERILIVAHTDRGEDYIRIVSAPPEPLSIRHFERT